jgi:hypothetical protein
MSFRHRRSSGNLIALCFAAWGCGDPAEPTLDASSAADASMMDAHATEDALTTTGDDAGTEVFDAARPDAPPAPDAPARDDASDGRCRLSSECEDDDACTADSCVDGMCFALLVDDDLEGHAPRELGACGSDCNDARGDVSPDQRLYFTDPILGAPAGARFDYDCDGTETPRDAMRGSCTPAGAGTCTRAEGWATTPPACGSVGGWIVGCTRSGAGCEQRIEVRAQACR